MQRNRGCLSLGKCLAPRNEQGKRILTHCHFVLTLSNVLSALAERISGYQGPTEASSYRFHPRHPGSFKLLFIVFGGIEFPVRALYFYPKHTLRSYDK